MELEVISRQPGNRRHTTSILLVHGAWHGAWCWDDGFMQYFADRGWEIHALSLRGHGKSKGRDRLRWYSIADYAKDLEQVVNSMPGTPLIIGHSMGGHVVQKYLQTHDAPGAVLLASVPKSGTWRFIIRLIRTMPVAFLRFSLTMSTWPIVETPELARKWFYSPDVPDEKIRWHHERLQDEAFRAALDMLILDLPRPAKVKTPTLVLAGENDAIFTVPDEQATARAYGTEAVVFPGMAHNMMSEQGWEKVADKIMAWAENS